MTFLDPDANLVIIFGQMTCSTMCGTPVHVLCLTRTLGSWLTIRPSSFNLNWFCPFQSSIRMQSFRVPQVLCHHSLSQAVFPSNKTPNREQEVGGGWARVKNWERRRRRGISPTISPTWISRSNLKLLAPAYFIETFQLERVPFSISSLLEESVNHLSSSTNRYPLSLFSVSSY